MDGWPLAAIAKTQLDENGQERDAALRRSDAIEVGHGEASVAMVAIASIVVASHKCFDAVAVWIL